MSTALNLLRSLFRRHSGQADADVERLLHRAGELPLPFDLLAQLRELKFPAQPPLPDGLPSTIYYFVPGATNGTRLPAPKSSTDQSFIKTADGIGLNFGCPLRLLQALDALASLPADDQAEPLAALRDPRHHLDTVEELLWLTGWRMDSVQRGVRLPGTNGHVDWRLDREGVTLHLEAKFRASDWPRLIEPEIYLQAGDGFLSKALHKFPAAASAHQLHVVGITTFDAIDGNLVNAMGAEIAAAPQIHAVVVRSFLQMTHVLSMHGAVAEFIVSLLDVPNGAALPAQYPVIFHIEQRDERRKSRPPVAKPADCGIVHTVIPPVGIEQIVLPEPSLYRLAIPRRGKDGEPVFEMIPKYKWS